MILSVLARPAKWLVVLTLIFSLGAQWTLLQSLAWAGMLVSYSQDASFSEAVTKTFDGKHPCCLCKIVQQGKASEKKREAKKTESKLDESLPCVQKFAYCPPSSAMVFPRFLPDAASRADRPPTPPPRAA